MANFAAVAQSELILIKWPKLDVEAVAAEDRPCAPAVRVRAACYVLRAAATKKWRSLNACAHLKCESGRRLGGNKNHNNNKKFLIISLFALLPERERDFMILLFVGFNDNDDDQ